MRGVPSGHIGWRVAANGGRTWSRAGAAQWALVVALLLVAARISAAVLPGLVDLLAASRVVRPVPPARPALLRSLTDTRPVLVTTTVQWRKSTVSTIADRVVHDRSLWREMHFEDWDKMPRALRERALISMLRAYRDVLSGPAVWRAMRTADWDVVPQPVRAIAYLRMTAYWSVHDNVGGAFGLDPRRVAQTVGAIVMAESWFEHRAVNTNPWGNRDLGLAQCSDYCRAEMAAMAERGEIFFAPQEDDYFNPLIATRVATTWFARELQRSGGDVELAIRAYHRGIENALDAKGDAYLERVLAKRLRYVRTVGAPPAWRFLVTAASRAEDVP